MSNDRTMNSKSFQYVRRNFDEASIVAALAAIGTSEALANLSDQEQMMLTALRRANQSLLDEPIDEIQLYLSNLEDEQVRGLVSNVKGILHEMEFVRLENDDGDTVYASIFSDANHPGTDILFTDESTGETWEVQLKATDNTSYVQDWVDEHPDGEILVTSELAEEMGLPSSGQSNEELTTRVENFVDEMIEADSDAALWSYFPALSIISISIIINELWNRYRRKEIDTQQFKLYVALATGLKATKIGALMLLLTIPVVGQVTGAILIAKLLLSAKSTWFAHPPSYTQPPGLQGRPDLK